MTAVAAAPGVLWVLAGLVSFGTAGGVVLACAAAEDWSWALLIAPAAGAMFYAAALIPAYALFPPWAAPAVAALVGLTLLAWALARRCRLPRRAPLRAALAAGAILVGAAVVGLGAGRAAYAVLLDTPFPAALGEPSSGDLGLHALRVAMIARAGVPPPSPLDPDYPLQYRYLFHVLAAAISGGGATTARATAATGALVAAALVCSGAALGRRLTGSWRVAVAGGALAALYGPSYWVTSAGAALAGGTRPGLRYFAGLMGDQWSLSPFTPAFPSILSAQLSSPGVPTAALVWLLVLCCFSAVAYGPTSEAPPGVSPERSRAVAVPASAIALGVSVAILVFAADFFAPLALASLGLSAAAWVRRGGDWRALLPALVGAMGASAALFGFTRQIGAVGAASGLHVEWNAALGLTPVYGGNHALLSGGERIWFPNWVAVHDWGVLFWPGIALAALVALRGSDAVLQAGVGAALGAALFWHLATVVYTSQTPTDFRLQMYRYASAATAGLAPLLPVAVYACFFGRRGGLRPSATERPSGTRGWQRWRPATGSQVAVSAALGALVVVGGGGGAYLVAGDLGVRVSPPPALVGDVALATRLAREPSGGGVKRLAVLNGPDSFVGMYAEHGGYVPLWWALGEAAVPVGWDFGHPERYQPLYHRVVVDFDPAAAAMLGLTHVALAPAQVPAEDRAAVERFVARCHGELLAEWGDAHAPSGRRLYRIDAAACGA